MRKLIADAAARLDAAGVPSARNDAEILASHVSGLARAALITAGDPTDEQRERYEALVARRAAREPLQHLTGVAWFRHVELEVGPGVFVPRPETESVVEAVLTELDRLRGQLDRPPVVVDLCTGSGAIPAAVADEAPDAQVHAVELSEDAFAYASRNLAGSGVDLRLGDAAVAFDDLDGQVDVVVSNPPYVPVGSIIRDPEVAEHDPAMALWGGPDGLDVVRVVARSALRLLRPGGLFVVEHSDNQGTRVPGALVEVDTEGWVEVQDHPDLTGRDRYCTARRV